jgi:hypothetical protein
MICLPAVVLCFMAVMPGARSGGVYSRLTAYQPGGFETADVTAATDFDKVSIACVLVRC